jgi:GT2 family glycosyltransferase
MTWEYLPQCDKRFEIAASYLKGKTKDKVIVDLDCLEARLLKYISHDFAKYLGNDILVRFPNIPKTEFHPYPDDQFVANLKKCDILCVFGHGGYEITGQNEESKTLTESIKKVVSRLEPQTVILEAVQYFEPIIGKIITKGYDLKIKEYMDLGEEWVKKRVIYIYERRPSVAIVVGSRNFPDYLEKTLNSMFVNSNKFALIGINQVPDKKTGEETEKVFKKYLRPQDVYIKNDPEVSVYEFWNQGLEVALKNPDIDYIGIFNDDLLLPPKWLETMLQGLKQGAAFLFPDWTSGPLVPDDWEERNKKLVSQPTTLYTDVLSGFCFMCPRSTFENVGLFDTQFKIWSGDTDFYFRMKKKGLEAKRIANVLIHHFYSRTLNHRRRSEKIEELLTKDRENLVIKHNINLLLENPPLKP